MHAVVLAASFLLAAPPEPAITVPIRLSKGQELAYSGVCTEESSRPGARFTRHYAVESYVLVLDAQPREIRAAFLTISRLRTNQGPPSVPAVRLEIGRIDMSGRISFAKSSPAIDQVPAAGPMPLETRAFVELPKDGVDAGKPWLTTANDAPAMRWSISGMENVGARCMRLLGEQRSANWDQLGKPAWKREDRVWLQLQSGFASRIERTIQHRDESGETVSRLHTRLELDNSYNPVFYPGRTFKTRQSTIERAVELRNVFDNILESAGTSGSVNFDGLLSRIDFALRNATETPYREALVALRRQAETIKNGERPPAPAPNLTQPDRRHALSAGAALPIATLTGIARPDALRLADLRGRPLMLVFFKGSSATIDYVLRYVAEAEARYAGAVAVVALATDDDEGVLTRSAHLKLQSKIYRGADLHRAIGGETTPLTVIADKSGVVRLIAPGWGGEYPDWFDKEIQKILQR